MTAEDFDFFLKIAKKNGKFFFLHIPLGQHLFHNRSASSNHAKHKASVKAVFKSHIFKYKKFDQDKEKIWKKANFLLTFEEFIIKLKNNEMNSNLFVKVFSFIVSNPFFSALFIYKIVIKKLMHIYLLKKNIIFQN